MHLHDGALQEVSDIYSSGEPQDAFQTRIAFCLKVHRDSVQAMRYNVDSAPAVEDPLVCLCLGALSFPPFFSHLFFISIPFLLLSFGHLLSTLHLFPHFVCAVSTSLWIESKPVIHISPFLPSLSLISLLSGH